MLRKLLACLALISGLAALGAPAQANFIEALGTQLETSEQEEKAKKTAECTCTARERQSRLRNERVERCKPERSVRIYIPTVQFGADRAFE